MFWKRLVFSFICSILATAASSQSTEVHAIAVNEGDIETGERVHEPEARVILDRPDARIELVLGSYDAVQWIVEASPQTSINMIYVHGRSAEETEVLLNGVRYRAERLAIGSTYRNQGSRFRALVAFLSSKFDVPRLASFQGAYTAPDEPFVVDKLQDAIVNQVGYLLPELRPEALTFNLRRFLEEPTEPVARLAADGFFLRKDGKELHFPVTPDVPEISRPGQAAYDPENQRLFAGTAWHDGFFYTFDILNNRWTAFEQPGEITIHGTVYDMKRDSLVLGVEGLWGAETSRLIRMTASGQMAEISHDVLLGLTDLEDIDNGYHPTLIPLAIDGDFLLARGQSTRSRPTNSQRHRTYLIDLVTGHVTLVDLSD